MWLICWGPQLNVAGRKLAIYILKRLMLHERLLLQKWYCVTQLKLLTYMRRTIVQWWQQQILWRYWQAWVLRGWLITIVTMALMTAITIPLMTMLMTTWAPLHSPWCSVPRPLSRPEKVFFNLLSLRCWIFLLFQQWWHNRCHQDTLLPLSPYYIFSYHYFLVATMCCSSFSNLEL